MIKKAGMINDDHVETLRQLLDIPTNHGHDQVLKTLASLMVLHAQKDHDYTGGRVPLSNFSRSENYGVSAWLSVMNRLSDKYARLEGLVRQEVEQSGYVAPQVAGESMEDTLLDVAVYAVIMHVLRLLRMQRVHPQQS